MTSSPPGARRVPAPTRAARWILDVCTRFQPANPWHFVWISCVMSVVLAVCFSTIQGLIFTGGMPPSEVFIYGGVDSVLVPLLVAPFVVYFVLLERRQAEDELRAISMTDELTGLHNRRGFFAIADHQLRVTDRMGEKAYLIYMDLDDFKCINDEFGHEVGDQALKAMAEMLVTAYRSSDIVARIGGDEFVVFPVNCASGQVETVVERFTSELDRFNQRTDTKFKLETSTGTACYDPKKPRTLSLLLHEADQSMFANKKARKRALRKAS